LLSSLKLTWIMLRILSFIAAILSIAKCCRDPRDKGFNCDDIPSGMRFYHDAKSGRCLPFFFQGCGGNTNNFVDRETCETSCLSSAKSAAEVSKTNATTIIAACALKTSAVLRESATACRTTTDCPAGHACSRGGSCCPTRDHICSLTPSNGNEAMEFVHRPKYAWISSLKNCIRFSYFGSNGNPNNFSSYKECKAFCG
ncbi:hypothetical protein PENTCL1PPCAC_1566, partial [Pristionchus entomophagus]